MDEMQELLTLENLFNSLHSQIFLNIGSFYRYMLKWDTSVLWKPQRTGTEEYVPYNCTLYLIHSCRICRRKW